MKLPADRAALASAVYVGQVQHRRHAPHPHAFRYPLFMLYLDLGELDRVFAGRWLWSVGRRNVAAFHREDYLGDPSTDAEPYESTSLIADADKLERPLLLIHGLADDNVLAAHTLQLSSALLANGKAHETLLLSGVSHMTPQEVVAENLLLHQVDFLRRALNLSAR